jgi:Fe-S-cluster-containing hydrogenase component 2
LSKVHSKKIVDADPNKCVGCCVCEYACSFYKEKSFNAMKSRIRAVRLNKVINLAVACRLCEDAPCIIACPREALKQRESDGTIQVNEDKCNGCGWCIEACDYGAIMLHPDKKVVFTCDLCEGDPKCVEWCPEEALNYVSKDSVAQKARITAVKKLFLEGLENSN